MAGAIFSNLLQHIHMNKREARLETRAILRERERENHKTALKFFLNSFSSLSYRFSDGR